VSRPARSPSRRRSTTLALLEALPARRVVLVGLSLGANIAQAVVRRRPDLAHAASNLDNPEAFTAVLLEFLERVVPPLELVADGKTPDRSADNRAPRRHPVVPPAAA
jgi:hypothetical protein